MVKRLTQVSNNHIRDLNQQIEPSHIHKHIYLLAAIRYMTEIMIEIQHIIVDPSRPTSAQGLYLIKFTYNTEHLKQLSHVQL